jgi:hypothetical protein
MEIFTAIVITRGVKRSGVGHNEAAFGGTSGDRLKRASIAREKQIQLPSGPSATEIPFAQL